MAHTYNPDFDEVPAFDDFSDARSHAPFASSEPCEPHALLLAARDGDLDAVDMLASLSPDLLDKALFECVLGRSLFEGRMREAFDDISDNLARDMPTLPISLALAALEEDLALAMADSRHAQVAALLAERGADLNARDCEGATAIILAARLKAWGMIKPLSGLGMDIFAIDARFANVADVAAASGYTELDDFFSHAAMLRVQEAAGDEDPFRPTEDEKERDEFERGLAEHRLAAAERPVRMRSG